MSDSPLPPVHAILKTLMHSAKNIWRRLAAALVCLALLPSVCALPDLDASLGRKQAGSLTNAPVKLLDRAKLAFESSRTQAPSITVAVLVNAAGAEQSLSSRLTTADSPWLLLSAAVRVARGRAPPSLLC